MCTTERRWCIISLITYVQELLPKLVLITYAFTRAQVEPFLVSFRYSSVTEYGDED